MRPTPDFFSFWFEFAGFGPSQCYWLRVSNIGDKSQLIEQEWPCAILIKTLWYCFHFEAKGKTFHFTPWEIWMVFVRKCSLHILVTNGRQNIFNANIGGGGAGFSNWKKVAGGNFKVAGALSCRDNGSLAEWAPPPLLQRGMGIKLSYFLAFFAPLTDFVERHCTLSNKG